MVIPNLMIPLPYYSWRPVWILPSPVTFPYFFSDCYFSFLSPIAIDVKQLTIHSFSITMSHFIPVAYAVVCQQVKQNHSSQDQYQRLLLLIAVVAVEKHGLLPLATENN